MDLKRFWLPVSGTILGFVLGMSLGWKIYSPRPVRVVEGKAEGQVLKDGSVLLPRDPDAKVPSLPKVLPKGATVARTVRLDYLPTVEITGSRLPVAIDLNVLTMPDGSTRILASTDKGEIAGGVDIPREPAKPDYKWAAGGMYSPVQKSYGVFADRDLGPWRVGLAVVQTQVQGLRSVDAWVKVGIRF